MSKLIGTPEEARKLSQMIASMMNSVDQDLTQLESLCKKVGSGLRDGREQDVEEMCRSIRSALQNATEGAHATEQHLEKYAELLESK